jgi:hypothetical protein
MPGLIWPHQIKPRHEGDIVDEQVKTWTFKQDEHRRLSQKKQSGDASSQPLGAPKDARRQRIADRLGFRYWGDVISTELTRLMLGDESTEAFLNDGMKFEPKDPPRKTESNPQPQRSARKRRNRDH